MIFDYEDANGALLGGFKAKLVLEKTSSMTIWDDNEDSVMSQQDFALFLEVNAGDIAEPESATMISIARELSAVKNVEFESKVKLENGSFVFSYKEENKGSVGKFEIPTSFFIGVAAYKGQPDAYKIECKFRYRVTPQGVQMWYSIPLLERVYENAFNDVREQIGNATKMDKVYDGTIGF